MFRKLTKRFRNFHSEDKGLEALQVVMIIAISAMLLIGVTFVTKKTQEWMGFQAGTIIGADEVRIDETGITTMSAMDGEAPLPPAGL